MSKRLVVFDVDSTLIDNEVIELIADFAGTRELVSQITDRAMRGEIDFAQSLTERVSTLAGVSVSVFDEVLARITVTRGVPEFISEAHNRGHKVAAVSGGFHEILDSLGDSLGLDYWRANRLNSHEGILTGTLDGPIIDAAAKADALLEWSLVEGIDLVNTIAIGDGANDLAMMAVAGVSVGFCAKPIVNENASVVIGERDMRLAIDLLKD